MRNSPARIKVGFGSGTKNACRPNTTAPKMANKVERGTRLRWLLPVDRGEVTHLLDFSLAGEGHQTWTACVIWIWSPDRRVTGASSRASKQRTPPDAAVKIPILLTVIDWSDVNVLVRV